MNPPFGTRNTGIDTAFVLKGMEYASTVYSLHKTSTRDVSPCSIICQYIYMFTTRVYSYYLENYLLLHYIPIYYTAITALCPAGRGTRLHFRGAGGAQVRHPQDLQAPEAEDQGRVRGSLQVHS